MPSRQKCEKNKQNKTSPKSQLLQIKNALASIQSTLLRLSKILYKLSSEAKNVTFWSKL